MSTGREDVDTALNRAVSAIDQAIIDNHLQGESLGEIMIAQKAFLTAQWAIYVTADQDMAGHLEQARVYLEEARQPVRDEEMQRAVSRGIAAHAWSAVKAINLRTASWLAVGAMAFALVGFSLGGWWQHDRMAAQAETAYNTIVAVNDGFGTGLKAIDASIWLDLIRMNPTIRDSLHQCEPMKQPAGSACTVPLWTMLPPPKTAAPGTH
jgi:hypothetical protein